MCLSLNSKAFQGKPVIRDFSLTIKRESSRQKWENGCHNDPRSAGDAARLYACYHLPSSLDGAECHHAPQKRLTRRRQQQADDAHSVLIKLRGFGLSAGHFTLSRYAKLLVRRRMMPSPPSKAAFPLALPAPLSAPYGDAHRASYAKTRKESQDPRSRKSSLGNAPRPLPCHRHHALWE